MRKRKEMRLQLQPQLQPRRRPSSLTPSRRSQSLLVNQIVFFALALIIILLASPTYTTAAATPQQQPPPPPPSAENPYSELGNAYVVVRLDGAGEYPITELLVVDFNPSFEMFGKGTTGGSQNLGADDADDSSSAMADASEAAAEAAGADQPDDSSDNPPSAEDPSDNIPDHELPTDGSDGEAIDVTDGLAGDSGLAGPSEPSDPPDGPPSEPLFEPTFGDHTGIAFITPHPLAVRSARILHGARNVVCYMLETPDFGAVENLPIRPDQPLELGEWPFVGVGGVVCVMPR